MKKYKTVRKADIILALVIAAAALCLIFFQPKNGGDVTAQITYNGKVVETIKLKEVENEYTLKYGSAVILVENGAISFESSGCPSQDCVRSGKLTRGGQAAACIPNRVMISLSSDGEKRSYQTY